MLIVVDVREFVVWVRVVSFVFVWSGSMGCWV